MHCRPAQALTAGSKIETLVAVLVTCTTCYIVPALGARDAAAPAAGGVTSITLERPRGGRLTRAAVRLGKVDNGYHSLGAPWYLHAYNFILNSPFRTVLRANVATQAIPIIKASSLSGNIGPNISSLTWP